jgi:predicted acetyltransferase
MDRPLVIGKPHHGELHTLTSIISTALHLPAEELQMYMAHIGTDNYRSVRVDGQPVAGLSLLPVAQWFVGRRVPMVGITTVGVHSAWRGSGVGLALMRSALEEIQAMGVPLSALYPATLRFYRKLGYERAGQHIGYELSLAEIDVVERGPHLIQVDPGQYEHFADLYEQRARHTMGHLDRPGWMLQRRIEQQEGTVSAYVVVYEGQREGYVVFGQSKRNQPLTVLDVCALTPRAGQRLLTLFADHRTMIEHVAWPGGPTDPLLYLLNENMSGGMRSRVQIRHLLDWMLRIIDVPGALMARGYPAGITAELHFDIHDDVLSTNNGHFILQVADGQAQVSSGGSGHIRLGIRELAALYSSFMAPVELQAIGVIDGPAADLALAGAVFSGPRPWMPDIF